MKHELAHSSHSENNQIYFKKMNILKKQTNISKNNQTCLKQPNTFQNNQIHFKTTKYIKKHIYNNQMHLKNNLACSPRFQIDFKVPAL